MESKCLQRDLAAHTGRSAKGLDERKRAIGRKTQGRFEIEGRCLACAFNDPEMENRSSEAVQIPLDKCDLRQAQKQPMTKDKF
jgi:hypothetical protein